MSCFEKPQVPNIPRLALDRSHASYPTPASLALIEKTPQTARATALGAIVATLIVLVLLLLCEVLGQRTRNCTTDCAYEPVTDFVSAPCAGCAASKRTQEAAIAVLRAIRPGTCAILALALALAWV